MHPHPSPPRSAAGPSSDGRAWPGASAPGARRTGDPLRVWLGQPRPPTARVTLDQRSRRATAGRAVQLHRQLPRSRDPAAARTGDREPRRTTEADGPDTMTVQLARDGNDVGGPIELARHADGAPIGYYPLLTTFDRSGTWAVSTQLDGESVSQAFRRGGERRLADPPGRPGDGAGRHADARPMHGASPRSAPGHRSAPSTIEPSPRCSPPEGRSR